MKLLILQKLTVSNLLHESDHGKILRMTKLKESRRSLDAGVMDEVKESWTK
jgi:hypothetical protein